MSSVTGHEIEMEEMYVNIIALKEQGRREINEKKYRYLLLWVLL